MPASKNSNLRDGLYKDLLEELTSLIKEMLLKETPPPQDLSVLNEIKEDIKAIKTSQTFLSNQFDEINNNMKQITNDFKNMQIIQRNMEEQIKNLQEKEKKNEIKLDEFEQINRQTKIEFHGIQKKQLEDPKKIVSNVCSKLGVQLDSDSIKSAFRLPPRENNVNNPIIVTFAQAAVRNQVFISRKKLREIEQEDFKNIFINENLTPYKKSLFYKVRMFKKKEGFKYAWTNDGTIYIRRTEDSKRIRIDCEEDINKLL